MILELYKLHLYYIYFIKGIYKKRNTDNTTNAIVLGILLLILNLHSIIILLECSTNINLGLLEFWKPNETPKVGLGYIGGFFLAIIYLLGVYIVKKNTNKKVRRSIMKKVVYRGRNNLVSMFYTLFSVLFFITTLLLLIVTIIS